MQREEVTFVMLRDRSARARVCMRERMSQLQNNTCFCLYDLPCEMRATLRPLRYLFRRNPRAIVASAMLHALHDLSHRFRPACSLPRRPRSSSGRRREAAVLRGERRGRGGGSQQVSGLPGNAPTSEAHVEARMYARARNICYLHTCTVPVMSTFRPAHARQDSHARQRPFFSPRPRLKTPSPSHSTRRAPTCVRPQRCRSTPCDVYDAGKSAQF